MATLLSAESNSSLAELLATPVRQGGLVMAPRWSHTQPNLSTLVRWRDAAPPWPSSRPRSCAVVGNSFSLLLRRDGAQIDAHEWVLRINNAPTPLAARSHLGLKTTLYVNTFPDVRPLNASSRRTDRTALPLVRGTPALYYCHVEYVSRCLANAPAADDGMQRFSPRFAAKVRDEVGIEWPKWPSSGAMAIAFALNQCETTHLYGFGDGGSKGCARYFAGSYRDCSSTGLQQQPEKCVVYGRGATRRKTGCVPMQRYLRRQHYYHDWEAEAAWVSAIKRRTDPAG
ncbi:hypothetical protein AB1Y20_019029 [Prymnesium parvum]|uniref:Uncharacterized protein n=1 Tax=Prymnesium parvum TaxID=97485 RepID=A0AB34JRC1_PRYPA